MSATQFTADIADIRFLLFDQLKVHETLQGIEKYSSFDKDIYESTVAEIDRLAREVIWPINRSGDRIGVKLDGKGNVTTPPGYKEAWDVVTGGGWMGAAADVEHGGTGLPHVFGVLQNELFTGAGMAFTMYMGLTAGVARVLAKFGHSGRGIEYAKLLFSGKWGGTMCLTEAGAGTAVGDNRTKATRQPEGHYLLEGEKIFISGGDQDLTENILHLALARLPDAPAGTKGLSLFIVPKFLHDENFNLTERNGAYVVGVEHKMGIHASSTCVLAFGQQGPCKGWLVGKEGEGMELMFTLMNEARIGVGIQGVATAAVAHQVAKAYAKDRIQGTSIKNFRDPNAARVAIIEHPDVRRNLMNQKVLVELMRAFVYRIAHRLDVAENSPDQALREKMIGQVDLLVPVIKGFCSDTGFQVTVDALQTFGGYGYTAEYPAEQFVRDAKIASIYEGTNGVQAMDLLGRKMRQKGGALFMEWMADAQQELAVAAFDGFGDASEAVNKAINTLGQTAMHLGQLGMSGKMDSAMLQAYPFLMAFGWVQLGVEAVNQARVAKALIAERGEDPHLVGKLLNLDWYTKQLLPNATAQCKAIQNGAETAMDPRLFV